MSKFRESYLAGGGQVDTKSLALADMVAEYPNLCEVLEGVRSDDGHGWAVWPATVMIFVEVDRLKFCINPQSGPRIAFGVVRDPPKGFASIEQALATGEFEWKKRGRKG